MKKVLVTIVILSILLLSGCSNEVENLKNEYLAYKNDLQASHDFATSDTLPCDITISLDKIEDDEISYRAIIDKPRENMYNIKALVIHNYFTSDIFPTIGIFDADNNLIVGDETLKGISLVGYIETDKEVEDLNLEIRVLLEYENDDGEIQTIYYKST